MTYTKLHEHLLSLFSACSPCDLEDVPVMEEAMEELPGLTNGEILPPVFGEEYQNARKELKTPFTQSGAVLFCCLFNRFSKVGVILRD